MNSVVISGAAGFLGSHMMLHHMQQGDFVVGIDNYCTSDPDSEHVLKIKTALKDSGNGILLHGDITNYSEVSEAFRIASNKSVAVHGVAVPLEVDTVYNFACPASPPQYDRLSMQTLDTCYVGTKNVLNLAKLCKKATVLHASTSEVYGDPHVSPQPETYWGHVNSFGPRACYDEGKRVAESLCYDFQKRSDLDVRIVRIFNTYGPHMDPHDGRVVSNFVRQVGNDEPITVYGSGNQTRSFCYVSDLIAGITSVVSLAANPGHPVNVGNSCEFTVNELTAIVKKLFPLSRSKVTHSPLPKDDPRQRRPDLQRINFLVSGWQPEVTLKDGVYNLANYWYKLGVIKNRPIQ